MNLKMVENDDANTNKIVITAVTLHPSLSSDVQTTTSPPPPPSPPSKPDRGDYNVTNNGTACLMASMGLQLNITYMSLTQGKVHTLTVFPDFFGFTETYG